MNWTYLIIPFAVLVVAVGIVPVVVVALGDRRRTDRRTGVARPGRLQAVGLTDVERPSTCIACGRPVADEETHWKAIHHVPA